MALSNAVEQLSLSDESHEPKRFKIGLDYGTTYSAGTFCLYSGSTIHLKCDEIYPFYGYPHGRVSSKKSSTEIPSEILYDNNGVIKVGYDAMDSQQPSGFRIRRAKLGLDERPETSSARLDLIHDLNNLPSSKQPKEVIADYLTELFKLFKARLISVGYASHDLLEFNCAVPAIWNHRARRTMVSAVDTAAKRSGLASNPVVRLWPEAEAAAEHALSERKNINLQARVSLPPCLFVTAFNMRSVAR